MSSDIILGIDLGTTFSVAAYVDDDGRARVILNAEGQKTTPSVVLIKDGQIQVGEMAANQAIAEPKNVVRWVKRAIGNAEFQFQGLNAIEISAEILKKIKADCEEALSVTSLDQAVITVPAYFDGAEVANTRQAGELAGFKVQEIVKEPTAAAVYYGIEHLNEGDKLLVCDLGGGTYDASILTLENGTFTPLATMGDRQLGGHEWTSALVEYAAENLKEVYGKDPRTDLRVKQSLYEACEKAKRSLAQAEEVVIPCIFAGQSAEVIVTRAQFETMTEWGIRRMIERTEQALTKPVKGPLRWSDINMVLLVGGSSRLRRVSEALGEVSGLEPILTAEVDTMVALGAAIIAKGHVKPRRIAPHSGLKMAAASHGGITAIKIGRIAERNLGTRAIMPDQGGKIGNSIIIPYGSNLPVDKTSTNYHLAPGQNTFDVPVVEFDGKGPDVIHKTLRFTCPPNLPKNTAIHVTFSYDLSGEIEVSAVEQARRTSLKKELVKYNDPQPVTPVDIVFVVDVSGSMQSYGKIERAKQAVIENSQKLIQLGGGQIRVGVVTFESVAHEIISLTTDIQQISQEVAQIYPTGGTAMDDGLEAAINMLRGSGQTTQCKALIVSDGQPNNASAAQSAAQRAKQLGIELLLVGIGREDVDEAFLHTLSDKVFMIDDAAQLSAAISLLILGDGQSGGSSGITTKRGE